MKYIKEINTQNTDLIGIFMGCSYLFFLFLSGSVFFPAILSTVSLLAFLAYGALVAVNRFSAGAFIISKYTIWYAVFIGYNMISIVFSPVSLAIGLNSETLRLMLICFIVSLLFVELIVTEKELSMICWANILSSFVMFILLYRSGKLVGDSNERLGNDVSGNANVFATFIMYSVMYSYWLLIYQEYSTGIKVVLCLSILTNNYTLMLSAGRKFFLIPFLFLFILLLMKNKNAFAQNAFKYTLLMVVIFVILYNVITQIPTLYNAIGVRLEGLVNSVTGKGEADESSIIRSRMRAIAIQGWLEHPIFGNGFDTYRYIREPLPGLHGYSHCNFTELLHNGGIVGFLIYYSIYGFLFLDTIRRKDRDGKFAAFTIAAIVCQFLLDYGGVFYNALSGQMLLMMAAQPVEPNMHEKLQISKQIRRYESRYIRE